MRELRRIAQINRLKRYFQKYFLTSVFWISRWFIWWVDMSLDRMQNWISISRTETIKICLNTFNGWQNVGWTLYKFVYLGKIIIENYMLAWQFLIPTNHYFTLALLISNCSIFLTLLFIFSFIYFYVLYRLKHQLLYLST